jgi:hypothetical protein
MKILCTFGKVISALKGMCPHAREPLDAHGDAHAMPAPPAPLAPSSGNRRPHNSTQGYPIYRRKRVGRVPYGELPQVAGTQKICS